MKNNKGWLSEGRSGEGVGGWNEGGNCILGKGEESTKALDLMELEDGQRGECKMSIDEYN